MLGCLLGGPQRNKRGREGVPQRTLVTKEGSRDSQSEVSQAFTKGHEHWGGGGGCKIFLEVDRGASSR